MPGYRWKDQEGINQKPLLIKNEEVKVCPFSRNHQRKALAILLRLSKTSPISAELIL
jgi:hypothetical protein